MRLCCRLAGHHTVLCYCADLLCTALCAVAVVCIHICCADFCCGVLPCCLPPVLSTSGFIPPALCFTSLFSLLSSYSLSPSMCHHYFFLSCPHLSHCVLPSPCLSSSLTLSSYLYLLCLFFCLLLDPLSCLSTLVLSFAVSCLPFCPLLTPPVLFFITLLLSCFDLFFCPVLICLHLTYFIQQSTCFHHVSFCVHLFFSC